MKTLKLLFIALLIPLFNSGCQKIVRPIAGNFTHGPEEFPSKLSPKARALIDQSFQGINHQCLRDFHVHAVGMGTNGTGIYVNPHMQSALKPWKYLQYQVYKSAGGITSPERADQQYMERLLKLGQADPRYGKLHLLAFDYNHNEDGTRNLEKSTFHIPNKYVVELSKKHPNIITPVISIHPDKPTALEELDQWGQMGVKYIKWLPNAQRIDPSLNKHEEFYKRVMKYDMAILTHTGHEKAVDGEEFQELANPLNFRYPLDMGVKIIMAHLASLGDCRDLDQPSNPMVSCFKLFMRLFEMDKYKNNLFGELSGTTIHTRVGEPLTELMSKPHLHARLINGSDYPLPAINILYRTKLLMKLGYISQEERKIINEIYGFNPLLFDFVLKRTMKHPKTGQKFLPAAFETPKQLDSCSEMVTKL